MPLESGIWASGSLRGHGGGGVQDNWASERVSLLQPRYTLKSSEIRVSLNGEDPSPISPHAFFGPLVAKSLGMDSLP